MIVRLCAAIAAAAFLLFSSAVCAQDEQSQFSANGNACAHSSGGVFGSDSDGAIVNTSSTEAMIVHCPLHLDGSITGTIYAYDRHETQNLVCTIQSREIHGQIDAVGSLEVSVLATSNTLGTHGEDGDWQWVPLSPAPFHIASIGWAYLRCVIPPATSLGTSRLKGYHFFRS